MTNLKVIDFIKWALTHAKSVPIGAAMPRRLTHAARSRGTIFLAASACRQPLQRSPAIGRHTSTGGWAGTDFDAAVAGWRSTDYATDCQGLLVRI